MEDFIASSSCFVKGTAKKGLKISLFSSSGNGNVGFTSIHGRLPMSSGGIDWQLLVQYEERCEDQTMGDKGINGGFRSRMDYYLYSGDKKHVFAGIAIISVLFGVPWYFMSRGAKHQSHQDYVEKADKARSQRLSSGSASVK